MSQSFDLGIRITADGRILTAEIKRSQESVQQLGATAQQAGNQVAQATARMEGAVAGATSRIKQGEAALQQLGATAQPAGAQVVQAATRMESAVAGATSQFKLSEAALQRLNQTAHYSGLQIGGGLQPANAAAGNLTSTLIAVGKVAFAGYIVAQATHVADSLVSVELQAQKLRRTIDYASGGDARASAAELDYLRGSTNRLGLEFNSASSAYVKLAASSKGTQLEGRQTRAIFEAIAKASTVMGLSAEETNGALLAISQMMSKGKVSAEELNGQLGERLPGAAQTAARAMGLTTAELFKMMEQGELLATDFLPRFAAQLEKDLGSSAEKAADELQSQISRMKNSWTEFQQFMAKAIIPAYIKVTAIAADAINSGNNVAKFAKQQGYGDGAAAFLGMGGTVLGALGVETDPKQIRENRLADMYTRLQQLQSGIKGVDQSAEGLVASFMKSSMQSDIDQLKAKIAKIEGAKLAEFNQKKWSADAARESASLANKTDPNANAGIEQQKAARIAAYMADDSNLPKAEKLKKELADEDKAFAAATINLEKNSERYQAALRRHQLKVAEIKESGIDKSAAADQRKAEHDAQMEQRKLDDLLAEGAGEAKTYAESMALLQKYALAHSETLKEGTPKLENYRAAVIRQITAHTAAGKAWHKSTEAAEAAGHAQEVWKAGHASQLQAIAEETAAIGQSAEARKIAIAVQQVKAETDKRIAALSKDLSEKERLAAAEEIQQEGEKQQAAVKTALIKQQALAGAYQLEQENRRFAADAIFDEQARAQAILAIDADTWRERIAMAAEGSDERKRMEGAFQQWYANQMAKPAIEATRRMIDSMDRTFHDGFVAMLEQGKADWDAFGKSLANTFKATVADEIYKMTVKPIVVNVLGAFSPVGATGAAMTAGGANGAQQGLGIMSGVQGAWSAFNGGMAGMASSFATSGAGQALGLSTAGQLMGPPTAGGAMGWTTTGATMTSAGSSMAAAAGPLAAALAAAYTLAEMNKGGWGRDNNAEGYAKSLVTGGIGTNIIVDRLFGHNRKVSDDAAGIMGTIDLSGFSGQNYQEKSQKGGTFRSDRRWTEPSAVESDMDGYIDSLVRQTVSGVQTVGKALGLETEKAMAGYSHSFQLQLTENGSWDKAGEKIAGELGKVSDELATRLLPNIEDFRRYGETASQTLTRLNAEFAGTDAILQILGKTAEQAFGVAGMASAEARERLIDYAGGMEQLATKTASFYQHYFTEEERSQQAAAAAQRQINDAFGALGIAVPKSTAEFKQLVMGQDLSTEAGAKLFNQLLDLESAFYATQQATDAAAKAAKEAIDAARGQQSGLFDRYASDAQKVAKAQGDLNRVFGEFGREVPKTSAEMVRLVQSLDPAVEADQRLLTALNGLTGAFDIVASSASTAADKQISAMQRVTAQMDQVASYKAGISSAQFDIRSKLPGFDAVGYYRNQGSGLRDQLTQATTLDQRLGLGEQLKTAILNRYQAEQDAINKTRDAQKTAFEQQRQAAQSAAQAQQQALQAQQQSAKQWNDAMLRLRDYAQSLLLSDASTLSPEDRLAEAERQYNAMLQRARGGDADAAGQVQANAQAYLTAARDYFATGTGYGAIFNQVQSGVAGLGATAQDPAALDARFQSQSLAYQQQAIAQDAQWQSSYSEQSAAWQAEDADLAQKALDELDALQQQADSWNEELKGQLQEQALNGTLQTQYLSDVASNTKDLDTRIASAIADAMTALQAQVAALAAVQAKSAGDLVYLTEQSNELLYSMDRTTRLESA